MERRCPTCNEKRGELAFQRLIDCHIMKTRECVHCIAAAAREFHKRRRAKGVRPKCKDVKSNLTKRGIR